MMTKLDTETSNLLPRLSDAPRTKILTLTEISNSLSIISKSYALANNSMIQLSNALARSCDILNKNRAKDIAKRKTTFLEE